MCDGTCGSSWARAEWMGGKVSKGVNVEERAGEAGLHGQEGQEKVRSALDWEGMRIRVTTQPTNAVFLSLLIKHGTYVS